MEKYDIIQEVGAGGYGSVYLCATRAPPGQLVAVKRFSQAHTDSEVMRLALREVRLLKLANHRNIVRLIEAFRSKSGRAYLVMEYIERTLTFDLAKQPTGLAPPQVKLFLWQLLQGVGYLHRMKIFHRDIKPANILVSQDGVVKLCDFGFARSLHPEETSRYSAYVVTRWYRAPELLVGDAYGAGVDVWSLGCVFAELLNGRPLLPGSSTADQLSLTLDLLGSLSDRQMRRMRRDPNLSAVQQAPAPHSVPSLQQRFPDVPADALSLLGGMLQPDPANRPTARQALSHPYFADLRGLLPTLADLNPMAFSCIEDNLLVEDRAQQAASAARHGRTTETGAARDDRSTETGAVRQGRSTETGGAATAEATARSLLLSPAPPPASLSTCGGASNLLLTPPPVAARGCGTPLPRRVEHSIPAPPAAGLHRPVTPPTRRPDAAKEEEAAAAAEEVQEEKESLAALADKAFRTSSPRRPALCALVKHVACATSPTSPPPLLTPQQAPPPVLKALSPGEPVATTATHGKAQEGGQASRPVLRLQVPAVPPAVPPADHLSLLARSDSCVSTGSVLSCWHNDLMSPPPSGCGSPVGNHLDDRLGLYRRDTSSRASSPSSATSLFLLSDVLGALDCLLSSASDIDCGTPPAARALPGAVLARLLPARVPVRRRGSSGLLSERGSSGPLLTIISEELDPALLAASASAIHSVSTRSASLCLQDAGLQPLNQILSLTPALRQGDLWATSSSSSSPASSLKPRMPVRRRVTMSGTGSSAAAAGGGGLLSLLGAPHTAFTSSSSSLGGGSSNSRPSVPVAAAAAAAGGPVHQARHAVAPLGTEGGGRGRGGGSSDGGAGAGPGQSRLSSMPGQADGRSASMRAASTSWSGSSALNLAVGAGSPSADGNSRGPLPHVSSPHPVGLIFIGSQPSVTPGASASAGAAVMSVADYPWDAASGLSSESCHPSPGINPRPPPSDPATPAAYKRVGRQPPVSSVHPGGQSALTHPPAAAGVVTRPSNMPQRTPRSSSSGQASAAAQQHAPLHLAAVAPAGMAASVGVRGHPSTAAAPLSVDGGGGGGGGGPTLARSSGGAAYNSMASGLLSRVRRLSSRIDSLISNPFSSGAAAAAEQRRAPTSKKAESILTAAVR